MKVRIGRVAQFRMTGTPADQKKVQDSVQDEILKEFTRSFGFTAGELRQIARRISDLANREAVQLFDYISKYIDRDEGGVGDIDWKPLTPGYVKWKRRALFGRFRTTKYDRGGRKSFYQFTGKLQHDLERRGQGIVRNRFGGVVVTTDVRTRNVNIRRDRNSEPTRASTKIELGSIDVRIFPRIAPSLLPMLASGQWTSVGNGEFERAMLPGYISNKVGGGGRAPYRPLVLPLTQFWIQTQIPAAISKALHSESQKIYGAYVRRRDA